MLHTALKSSSPSVSPSVSEVSRLICRFGWLQSLFGSLGFNLFFCTAPSTVPDTPPLLGGLLGEWCGMKLHLVDSHYESSGVGALDNSAKSTSHLCIITIMFMCFVARLV